MDWTKIRYFSQQEWEPHSNRVSPALIQYMDVLRYDAGVPIVIHVAAATSGHSENSFHYFGNGKVATAVDFRFLGLSYAEQFALLSSYDWIGGLGFYPHWNHPGWHVDMRETSKRLLWHRTESGHYIYGWADFARMLCIIGECRF